MQNKKVVLLILMLFTAAFLNAQVSDIDRNYKLSDIRDKVVNTDDKSPLEVPNMQADKKSPGLSILLSLVLPGAGHYYAGRSDVGAYFFGAEVGMWLGLFGVNYYGNILRDDSRSFAATHSGLDKSGKDDDYFSNVGNYLNIYDYNNDKLARGEYEKLYDVNTHFWNWDLSANMDSFESQRKRSERTYNLRTIFVTGMILNRLVSGISALVLTNKGNNSGGIRMNSELIMTPENRIDGLKLNFVKSF